jgi:hypothetical protein
VTIIRQEAVDPAPDGVAARTPQRDLIRTARHPCFARWVEELCEAEPDLIVIDSKTSRRTHARSKGREPLHLVSAWASRLRLVLGQEAVSGK